MDKLTMPPACCLRLQQLLNSSLSSLQKLGRHQLAQSAAVKGVVVVNQSLGATRPGKLTTIQLYSSTQVDSTDSGRGKLSEDVSLRYGKNTKHGEVNTITYPISFNIEIAEFGAPGAVVVKNGDRHQFFLRFVIIELPGGQSIHFDCNSWVYPMAKTNADRLFFSNNSYLPSETPEALRKLRKEELVNLRGNGRGERKDWERIYDYDVYNDLGDPEKGSRHVRPVLGGSKTYPYPRRGRTGRPISMKDRMTETRHKIIDLDFYVPPDERFSQGKFSEFILNSIQAIVHFVIPEVKSFFQGDNSSFESFEQMMKDLYSGNRNRIVEGIVMEKLKSLLADDVYKEVVRVMKENPVKFPVPQVISTDEFAWKSDEEFARQMLAGINPAVIKCLENFPPISRGGKPSSITAAQIERNLEGLTLKMATDKSRIFILDHHDYLMPYLSRLHAQGVRVYASRTLLFLRDDQTLAPLAIELSFPLRAEGEEGSRVFLPASQGTEGALWQLAKAHVAVNDSGHHQLISHWLHTHAVIEPFVIATRRQLSTMHPIHKLLDPHFKDTMHINALARSILLNSGGIFERTMSTENYAMEISSSVYEGWRFDEQGLPADLLKRRVAFKDPNEPSGVHLLFEDYPYAADGLDVWTAIKTWVSGYCSLYYPNDKSVSSDVELRAWWSEIQLTGHGDKREGWYQMTTLADLIESLTTLIWIASALHASVNFGQWGYAGFAPNRPTKCRKFIPYEGTAVFAEFIKDPDRYYLEMLGDRFSMTLGLALIEILSRHAGDEVYIGQRTSEKWTESGEALRLFREFGENLKKVERKISERNMDPRLKNRRGPVKVPYTLLFPDTSNVGAAEKGITGKGIPNSVSI